ncbi:IS3 family transposase [Streptococcus vestibularis]|uniref:IS3 family transposase n=1 Tax=Streptococcus vestibularis TaxID=1343 RepID=UPI0012B8441C
MEKLVTDITYLYFGNCRLYLSSIMLHKWRNLTKDNITDIVKNYIIFYNETRKRKLNGRSPVEYRKLVA